jgi:hypothetical protein
MLPATVTANVVFYRAFWTGFLRKNQENLALNDLGHALAFLPIIGEWQLRRVNLERSLS